MTSSSSSSSKAEARAEARAEAKEAKIKEVEANRVKTPQERATLQTERLEKMKKIKKTESKESTSGSLVHNILKSGHHRLEAQSPDKSTSNPVHEQTSPKSELVLKRKVSFVFPHINASISQRLLVLTIQPPVSDLDSNPDPYTSEEVFIPDIVNKSVLLPLNSKVHLRLSDLDGVGNLLCEYTLEFNTDPRATAQPEASPISYEILEEVSTLE